MIKLEDRLYTSTEVAEILGVSLRSVYRYLEESKLKAEVKTATGRHRFTKQNIIDFLYPEGVPDVAEVPVEKVAVTEEPVVPVTPAAPVEEPVVPEAPTAETPPVAPEEVPTAETTAAEEDQVDWLAKFREAAQKFKEEAAEEAAEGTPEVPTAEAAPEPTPAAAPEVAPAPKEEPAFAQESFSGLADVVEEPKEEPTPVASEAPQVQIAYYRSGLGGLKDIAQNIDKGARKSNLNYAFTLNAGLSLYKPIKPFSTLHAYVNAGDVEFFEKMLALTPTDEKNAQLCLVLSEDADIYSNREELHGLFVVSKQRLMHDVENSGEQNMLKEAQSALA